MAMSHWDAYWANEGEQQFFSSWQVVAEKR